MTYNPDLACLLNTTVVVLVPTETTVNMVTTETYSASTGIATQIQPLRPDETARAYGYEAVGAWYQAFFQSTAPVAVGDLLRVESHGGSTTASFVGFKFWLRGFEDDAVWPGINHKLAHLELTERGT